MNYLVLLSVVVLHFLSKAELTEAETVCKQPNGNTGTCVVLSKCPPIEDIYEEDDKTDVQRLFLRQSYCSTSARHKRSPRRISISIPGGVGLRIKRKKKVCCPAASEWDQFQPTPDVDKVPETVNIDERTGSNTRTVYDYGDVVSGTRYCGVEGTSSNKITGGSITTVDQYPWLVLLEYVSGDFNCGGSLISPRFVLTAAHCIDSSIGQPTFARLGEYNKTSFPTDIVPVRGGGFERVTVQRIRVDYTIMHRDFDIKRFTNDIGLVILGQNAVFSDTVKTVCLPGRDFTPEFTTRTKLYAAGWGEDPNDRRFDDVKKDVDLPYVSLSECEKQRRGQIYDTQICAGGVEGKDSCAGDSGGPLMYEYKQVHIIVGITSYGLSKCGTKGVPAIYTHVYKYLDWIKDTLRRV